MLFNNCQTQTQGGTARLCFVVQMIFIENSVELMRIFRFLCQDQIDLVLDFQMPKICISKFCRENMEIYTHSIVFKYVFILTIWRVVICIDSVSCKGSTEASIDTNFDCRISCMRKRMVPQMKPHKMAVQVIKSYPTSARSHASEKLCLVPMMLIRKKQKSVLHHLRASQWMIAIARLTP